MTGAGDASGFVAGAGGASGFVTGGDGFAAGAVNVSVPSVDRVAGAAGPEDPAPAGNEPDAGTGGGIDSPAIPAAGVLPAGTSEDRVFPAGVCPPGALPLGASALTVLPVGPLAFFPVGTLPAGVGDGFGDGGGAEPGIRARPGAAPEDCCAG